MVTRTKSYLTLTLLALAVPGCKADFSVFDQDREGGVNGGEGCIPGQSRCDNNAVYKCTANSIGAYSWSQETLCTASQQCQALSSGAACLDLASCSDGKKNQDETDVDCGGTSCGKCAGGKGCGKDSDCITGVCQGGTCAPCKAGTYDCLGNYLRRCKQDNSGWDQISTCDPKQYERCDPIGQVCVRLKSENSPTATGKYYLFSYFEKSSSEFKGGYDVDGIDDLLYVNNNRQLDVYKVTIVDSDVDGKADPNQHPDNPDKKGPIEQRTLKYLKTYSGVQLGQPSVAEIFAAKDRVYFLRQDSGSAQNIYEYILATGQTNLVIQGNVPQSCIGYDDKSKQWYGAYNSSTRVVYNFWPNGGGWAPQFWYPDLAGSHLDGIEVVQDPKTQIPYVYVSDMTSDFLAQYYLDKTTGKWVQKNVFAYKEDKNQYVEGMGFDPFFHFWATSGTALYEVGGGDLQKYVGQVK